MEVIVIQGVEMFMKEQGQDNMGAWKKGTHVGQFTGSRKASQERWPLSGEYSNSSIRNNQGWVMKTAASMVGEAIL